MTKMIDHMITFITGLFTYGGNFLVSWCSDLIPTIFMVLIFGVVIFIGVLVDMVDELPSLPVPLAVLLPLGAAAGTALSIPLSMKLYKEN